MHLPWWAVAALGMVGGVSGLTALAWKWALDNEEAVIEWGVKRMEQNATVHDWLANPENQKRLNALMEKGVAAVEKNEPKS